MLIYEHVLIAQISKIVIIFFINVQPVTTKHYLSGKRLFKNVMCHSGYLLHGLLVFTATVIWLHHFRKDRRCHRTNIGSRVARKRLCGWRKETWLRTMSLCLVRASYADFSKKNTGAFYLLALYSELSDGSEGWTSFFLLYQ